MTLDRPIECDLPRAHLRVVLLVLVANGPTHGYELLEQVRTAGIRLADPGGLYRALRTMDQQELLESWWEDSSSGPPRRTYALTSKGRAALAAEIDGVRVMVDLLGRVVDRAERALDGGARAR